MALSLSQTVTATLFAQSDEIADEVLHSDAFLVKMEEKGRVKRKAGGYEFRRPVAFQDVAVGGFFSGFDAFDLTVLDDLTAFQFAIKQVYEPLGISGREKRANREKEQLIDLVETKVENARRRLRNTVVTSLYGDGTAFSGLEFDGLQKAVSTSPSTGSYGGISRVDYDWARNVAINVGGGFTVGNIKENITDMVTRLTRGSQAPDLGVADRASWRVLHDSLTPIQRINDQSKMAKAGFKSLQYDGVDFTFEGYEGPAPSNQIRILTTEFWDFTMVSGADFKPLEPSMDRPVDQDAYFTVILVEGNLCCSAPVFQGVLYV